MLTSLIPAFVPSRPHSNRLYNTLTPTSRAYVYSNRQWQHNTSVTPGIPFLKHLGTYPNNTRKLAQITQFRKHQNTAHEDLISLSSGNTRTPPTRTSYHSVPETPEHCPRGLHITQFRKHQNTAHEDFISLSSGNSPALVAAHRTLANEGRSSVMTRADLPED